MSVEQKVSKAIDKIMETKDPFKSFKEWGGFDSKESRAAARKLFDKKYKRLNRRARRQKQTWQRRRKAAMVRRIKDNVGLQSDLLEDKERAMQRVREQKDAIAEQFNLTRGEIQRDRGQGLVDRDEALEQFLINRDRDRLDQDRAYGGNMEATLNALASSGNMFGGRRTRALRELDTSRDSNIFDTQENFRLNNADARKMFARLKDQLSDRFNAAAATKKTRWANQENYRQDVRRSTRRQHNRLGVSNIRLKMSRHLDQNKYMDVYRVDKRKRNQERMTEVATEYNRQYDLASGRYGVARDRYYDY